MDTELTDIQKIILIHFEIGNAVKECQLVLDDTPDITEYWGLRWYMEKIVEALQRGQSAIAQCSKPEQAYPIRNAMWREAQELLDERGSLLVKLSKSPNNCACLVLLNFDCQELLGANGQSTVLVYSS